MKKDFEEVITEIIQAINNIHYEDENKELLKKTYKDDVIITKTIETLKTLKGSARWERHLYEIDELIHILQGDTDGSNKRYTNVNGRTNNIN